MALDARNRRLPDWFARLHSGQVKLPRFQRLESWSHNEVDNLLETVFRGRPIGAVLTLEIGDKEPFISRPIEGALDTNAKVTEHLLDGQQRLTALWKSFKDLYENRTYFARCKDIKDNSDQVHGQARWMRKGRKYPLWADNAQEVWKRGMVPISLLDPDTTFGEVSRWCRSVSFDSSSEQEELTERIIELQTTIRETNLPFLGLPVNTSPDDAIDVFIKMNTSSVPLKTHDIVVAQVEATTGKSLRDLEGGLHSAVPSAERYIDIPDLVLRVAALREDRPPTITSFIRLDFSRLADEWNEIQLGIEGAIGFLEDERIFDAERLPSVPVVQVIASIWSLMPQALDAHGSARALLRRYLWRSFFTNRYDRATNTAALQDFRGLKSRIIGKQQDDPIPVFNDEHHPLVDVGELLNAGWPRSRNTLARAILAVSLRTGGRDFADDKPANHDSLKEREYHHLFPDSLLKNDGRMEDHEINRALNCALVTWNTNRTISAKEPMKYLRERVERATPGEGHSIWAEEQVKSRIASHAIPYDALNVGGYAEIACEDARSQRIRQDYQTFLEARAEMIHKKIVRLCSGEAHP